MKTPACTVEQITPAIALEILEKQDKLVAAGKARQRVRSQMTVLKYATDMHQKLWRLAPEPIIFDVSDSLLDGQHRLAAVVQSGVTLPFYVSRGWPPEIIEVIDRGCPRSIGAMLQIAGVENASVMSGAISNFARIPFRGSSSSITYGQVQVLLHQRGVQDALEAIMRKAPSHRDMKSQVIGPLAWYYMVRPNKALKFADEFFNFQTDSGSPVATLLSWIRAGGNKRGVGGSTNALFRATCSCLRAWEEGRKLGKKVYLTYENVQWLADQNIEIRNWCKQNLPRGRREYHQDVEAKRKAREEAKKEAK